MEKYGLTKSALEDEQFAILKKKADRDLIVQFLPELLFIKELGRLFYSPLSWLGNDAKRTSKPVVTEMVLVLPYYDSVL